MSDGDDHEKKWEKWEEQLKDAPPTPPNKADWPKGVRSVSQNELVKVGVDRFGRLYWDGKAIEIKMQ